MPQAAEAFKHLNTVVAVWNALPFTDRRKVRLYAPELAAALRDADDYVADVERESVIAEIDAEIAREATAEENTEEIVQ